ncbi:ATP-binding cassette domain-containing protein [Rudanella lutea]|uniref:ATP-binding cassette domain-containing protein n=1 Tax=Rudanella lutea TaxID=451374 RepID=UPI0003744276|nr:ATP-binding cassette domain-containing protein [Rudanella lutea]
MQSRVVIATFARPSGLSVSVEGLFRFRVEWIINQSKTMNPNAGRQYPTLFMTLIALQNATLRRPNGFTLTNLNWTLEPKQHWAIMGPSGSGKSLFLETVAGRLPVAGGRLWLSDTALRPQIELVARDYSFDWRIAGAVQFYQQRFNTQTVDDGPTVWDVLQGQVRPVGTIDPASVPLPPPLYAEDWLRNRADGLRITHLLDRRLTSLSNGETRRTLLVRSLLKQPRILLLDNPFSGLDADSRAQLHETIEQAAQTGVSLVMVVDERDIPACITHRLVLGGGRKEKGEGKKAEGKKEKVEGIKGKAEEGSVAPSPFSLPPLPPFSMAIQMEDVTVRYGAKTVLDRVNWTVRRGEKWALLGPNGSGKSTLLSLITGDNPQAYANKLHLFDRRRGTGESIWWIKSRIGFVSPELHLYFPRQTRVWDVVASGLFDTMGLFRKLDAEQQNQVQKQLEVLGLTALRDRRLADLSAGLQRWVLLARALVKRPPLLILDEPTQGLDTGQVAQFRDLIDEMANQNPEQTLIYVTHYPDELPRCVMQTLRLAEGRVV